MAFSKAKKVLSQVSPGRSQVNAAVTALNRANRSSSDVYHWISNGSWFAAEEDFRVLRTNIRQMKDLGAIKQETWGKCLDILTEIDKYLSKKDSIMVHENMQRLWQILDGKVVEEISRWVRAPNAVSTGRSVVA